MKPVLVLTFAFCLLPLAIAQEPPRLLPASITGRQTPAARFNTQVFPADTLAGVQAVRLGADWLAKHTQPNGRLIPGFDPRTGTLTDADHELRQATAARALAEAAAFTGDERLGAVAAQATLGLLALTKELNGVRSPTVPAERCNPVAFAATLVLALDALPDAPKPAADALAAYLRTQVRADGGVGCGGDPNAVDRDGLSAAPGLVLLALSSRPNPPPVLAYYRTALRTRWVPELAAGLLPGAAAVGDAATAVELADRLCVEPPSALQAEGLAAACTVCRRTGDLTRYERYRHATRVALDQSRKLQYTAYSTATLPPATASRLIGAVALAPADPTARPDRAAGLVLAHLRFLASGAEGE